MGIRSLVSYSPSPGVAEATWYELQILLHSIVELLCILYGIAMNFFYVSIVTSKSHSQIIELSFRYLPVRISETCQNMILPLPIN